MIALRLLVLALGVALGVLHPFISVILADFGFGPGEIGLISSIGAVAFTLAVPAWGHLADVRLGRSRTLQVCALGGAAAVLLLLVPWPLPFVIAALFVVFWVFESSWQPLTDAITVNAVRGRDYARVRLLTSLSFAVATVVAGFVYNETGYAPAFVGLAIGAVAMTLAAARVHDVGRADLAAHRAVAATAPPRGAAGADAIAAPRGAVTGAVGATQAGAGAGTTEVSATGAGATTQRATTRRSLGIGSLGVALRVAPRLGLVLLAVASLHIGIIAGFTFLGLRIVELGGSPSDVALSSGVSAAAEIPAMLLAGQAARRLGLRGIFVGSALLYAACLASWTVLANPEAIIATRALTGVAFAGVVVGTVLTIAALLPADLQATGQALFQTTAFGIAAIIANVLGGLLYEAVGFAAVFGLGSVLAVVAAVVGWFAFPHRGGTARVTGRASAGSGSEERAG